MTKQTKIILGIVAGILVLCAITCVAGVLIFRSFGARVAQSIDADPVDVETTAQEIVDLDLPAGFQPQSSMDMFGVKMAMYTNPSNDNFMIITQLPMAADENLVEQMRENFARNTGYNFSNMETVEQRDLTVRGEPATLVVQEGVNNDTGERIRQLLLAFEGESGTAMIAVFGPTDTWDEEQYESMIESIR